MDDSKPNCVNSLIDIIRVNSFKLGYLLMNTLKMGLLFLIQSEPFLTHFLYNSEKVFENVYICFYI